MAGGFYSAVYASTRAVFGKAPVDDEAAASVTWTHAVTGIVVLVLLQAAIIVVPFSSMLPEALRAVVDFAVVALIMLAVPFLVLGGAGLLLNRRAQLPAIFLFLALILALSQLVGLVLGAFGIGSGTALIGILAFFSARAAKSLLGVGWGSAVLVGALVGAGTFAASFLFLMLPTGQAMLAAP